VCPSCQNMTSMFIDVFAHDQETLIIRWHMSWLTRDNQGPVYSYATHVLMFPLNTVIAWHIIFMNKWDMAQKYTLLSASRAYLLQFEWQAATPPPATFYPSNIPGSFLILRTSGICIEESYDQSPFSSLSVELGQKEARWLNFPMEKNMELLIQNRIFNKLL
jgi:hypothetical protein